MSRLKTPVSNPKKNFPAAKWLPDNGLVARLRAGTHYDDANWKDKTKIVRLPAVAHKDGVVWGNKNI